MFCIELNDLLFIGIYSKKSRRLRTAHSVLILFTKNLTCLYILLFIVILLTIRYWTKQEIKQFICLWKWFNI